MPCLLESLALTEAGATVTMIRCGERKFEGNQYEPLSRSARAAILADVDDAGMLLVETVSRNRRLSAAAVANIEGATYLDPAGVDLGLADARRGAGRGAEGLVRRPRMKGVFAC